MNYLSITKSDIANGKGVRLVLWVSGCNHACDECQNPESWNPNAGKKFDDSVMMKIFTELSKDVYDGITFSGGDPLFPSNREEVETICRKLKTVFPQKDIWMWTGYTWDEVKDLGAMQYVDVLIDGKYDKTLRDVTIAFRGSSNQNIIDVQPSLKSAEPVLLNEIYDIKY